MAVQILTDEQSRAKLKRMAYQIYEENTVQQTALLMGLNARGHQLAQLLGQHLNVLSGKQIPVVQTDGASLNAEAAAALAAGPEVVILVDDVLFSGRTLFRSLQLLAAYPLPRVQIAVLVNRGHRCLPIVADYTGVELATTLQEYIRVEVAPDSSRIEAWLADQPAC